MECPAGRITHLDVRRLDDRPPLLDLGALKRAERLRRLLITGENLLSDIGKLSSHARIGQCGHDGSVELGDKL
jgi:hypothetical protein